MRPILCAHLLRKTDAKLIELLRSLDQSEWDLPTVAGEWRVRDVAAHLLDTPLRKLSFVRDRWFVDQPDDGLVAFVNRLNREGVAVYRRLSPSVLMELMQSACEQSADFHESLDPFAPATFAVSWAGEQESLNWFDTARELTERWHHQQQIREAADRPGIMTRELYHPVLDCFVRGLPHHFRSVPVRGSVRVEISGECGGSWNLVSRDGNWALEEGSNSSNRVVIPQEIAWRVFTKGIRTDEALQLCTIDGDRTPGEMVLRLTAIVG